MITACVKGGTQVLFSGEATCFTVNTQDQVHWKGSGWALWIWSLCSPSVPSSPAFALLTDICFPVPLHLLINMSMCPELSSSFLWYPPAQLNRQDPQQHREPVQCLPRSWGRQEPIPLWWCLAAASYTQQNPGQGHSIITPGAACFWYLPQWMCSSPRAEDSKFQLTSRSCCGASALHTNKACAWCLKQICYTESGNNSFFLVISGKTNKAKITPCKTTIYAWTGHFKI